MLIETKKLWDDRENMKPTTFMTQKNPFLPMRTTYGIRPIESRGFLMNFICSSIATMTLLLAGICWNHDVRIKHILQQPGFLWQKHFCSASII